MDQLIGGYKLFSYGGKRLCQLKKIEGVHLTSHYNCIGPETNFDMGGVNPFDQPDRRFSVLVFDPFPIRRSDLNNHFQGHAKKESNLNVFTAVNHL